MEYVTVGVIVKVFGLQGEVKILSSSDFRALRYKKGNLVFLFNEKANTRIKTKVLSYHAMGDLDFVAFDGITDATQATALIGIYVQVEKTATPPIKNAYFHADLEQCLVYDEDKHLLGHVVKVEEFSAQRTLRVKHEKKEGTFFVPFIPTFIKHVDIEKKAIVIHVIEGLV